MLDETTTVIPPAIVVMDQTVVMPDIPQDAFDFRSVKILSQLGSSWFFYVVYLPQNKLRFEKVMDIFKTFGVTLMGTSVVEEDNYHFIKNSVLIPADFVFTPTITKVYGGYHRVREANTPRQFVDCLEYFSQSPEPFNKVNIESFLRSYGS